MGVKRVEWYVIFEDTAGGTFGHWLLGRFTRSPRHCYCVAEAEGGMLLAAQSVERLEIEYVRGLTAEAWAEHERRRGRAVETLSADVTDRRWVPSLRTCTGLARALAGLPPRVQTARGFLGFLRRRNMGGSSKPKRPSNAERNAAMLSAKKGSADARAISEQEAFLKRSRRRSSLYGGPESGMLGGAQATLGVGV